jgi:hypothetical protein
MVVGAVGDCVSLYPNLKTGSVFVLLGFFKFKSLRTSHCFYFSLFPFNFISNSAFD